MEDFLLSFEFRFAIWALLILSALAVLGLHWAVRRREKRLDVAETYQELAKRVKEKTEECDQLTRQTQDLEVRRTERDRCLAEETRAKDWLRNQGSLLKDLEEQNTKLSHLRDQYREYERAVAQVTELRSERERLQTEVRGLQELEQRKKQLEPIMDQWRSISDNTERKQAELKNATDEYGRVCEALQAGRQELHDLQTELELLRVRAERMRTENPFLADQQDHLMKQWKSLEGHYQDAISKNSQQWQTLEDQFKRLRDQAQRATSSLTL